MQDDMKSNAENYRHDSSESVERNSNALTLVPGTLLTGLSVMQIDRPHQYTLAQLAVTTALEAGETKGLQGSSIFRGTGGRDIAVFTQWMNRGAYDQAPQTLLKPSEEELYQVTFVDHIAHQGTTHIAHEDGLFHFINVFRLVPGKHNDFVDYFQHIVPAVRVQPGYVSANLLVSLDTRHAVNIGQFQTRQDFQAIFRQPRVIMAFAQGFRRRLVGRPPRLRLYDLLDVSLYHNTQV